MLVLLQIYFGRSADTTPSS